MAKPSKSSPRPVYIREEARALLEKLCDMECRSFTDQFTVVVREAAKSRGIDPDEFLRSVRVGDESAAA